MDYLPSFSVVFTSKSLRSTTFWDSRQGCSKTKPTHIWTAGRCRAENGKFARRHRQVQHRTLRPLLRRPKKKSEKWLAATSWPWTRGASRQKMTTPYLLPSTMAKQAFRWFGCLGFSLVARGRRCGETAEDVWVHRLGPCSRLPWRAFGPQAELESLCSICLPQKSRAAYASRFLVAWCGHADRDNFSVFLFSRTRSATLERVYGNSREGRRQTQTKRSLPP